MRITVLTVPPADAEAAADRLWGAGANAVEELDVDGGRVALRTVLASDDAVSTRRLGDLPARWELRFIDQDDAPSEAWREHATPIVVNDELVIAPAWATRDDHDAVGTVVSIEPAGSFGLGDHPTTRLSADAVWRLAATGMRLLDVGCGSGVLSIVGVLRGVEHATAIDVSDAAREATVDNARRNGVAERISASCRPVAEIEGEYDLVAANILAPTLVELADDLRRVLAPGGVLVVSGVLADHHEHVLAALAPLRAVATTTLEGWACVELRRTRP